MASSIATTTSADLSMDLLSPSTTLATVQSSTDIPGLCHNSTRPILTRTVTVPPEPETGTRLITIQSTSFTTRTVTTTVPSIPGVFYTVKTSSFPNISAPTVSEEWMTATGSRLCELLNLACPYSMVPNTWITWNTSSIGITSTISASQPIGEPVMTPISQPFPDESSGSTFPPLSPSPTPTSMLTTTSNSIASPGHSESSISFSLPSPPAVISASSTNSEGTLNVDPYSAQLQSSLQTIVPTTTSSTEAAASGLAVIPFSVSDVTSSFDMPITVAHGSKTFDATDVAWEISTTSDPLDHKARSTDSLDLAASRHFFDKRDTSWSALDARGYGMLIAWFIVGTLVGIICVLTVSQFRAWRNRTKLAGRIHRTVRRSSYSRDKEAGHDRRGSISPTLVSGMQSLSQDQLMDTRMLRRSWQEDSFV